MSKTQPALTGQPAAARWFRNPNFLPLLILALAIVGAAAAVVVSNLKQDPYDGARISANAFMEAFVNCDAASAKKYYVGFQTDKQQFQSYTQSCKPGGSFTFSRQISTGTLTKQGKTVKSVSYLYNLREGGYSGGIVVDVQWRGGQHKWVVSAITLTNTGNRSS